MCPCSEGSPPVTFHGGPCPGDFLPWERLPCWFSQQGTPCVGSVNAPGISLSLHTLLGKQKLRSIHCPLSERGSLHIASCPAPSFLVDGVFRPESDDLISTSLPILSLWPFLRRGSRSPQADEEHGSLMQSLSLISWQDVPRSWSLTKQSFVPRLLGSFH